MLDEMCVKYLSVSVVIGTTMKAKISDHQYGTYILLSLLSKKGNPDKVPLWLVIDEQILYPLIRKNTGTPRYPEDMTVLSKVPYPRLSLSIAWKRIIEIMASPRAISRQKKRPVLNSLSDILICAFLIFRWLMETNAHWPANCTNPRNP
jgi:hypothetical protein